MIFPLALMTWCMFLKDTREVALQGLEVWAWAGWEIR